MSRPPPPPPYPYGPYRPGPSPPLREKKEEPTWVIYLLALVYLVVGVVMFAFLIPMFTLMSTGDEGVPPTSLYSLYTTPVLYILMGILLLYFWTRRDKVISWIEKVFDERTWRR